MHADFDSLRLLTLLLFSPIFGRISWPSFRLARRVFGAYWRDLLLRNAWPASFGRAAGRTSPRVSHDAHSSCHDYATIDARFKVRADTYRRP